MLWLTFDGVYRAADVYFNGAFVGHHEDGYTSFNMYIHNVTNGAAKYGLGNKNVLAVYVDATKSELWCYEGGGIYRHVWLEAASQVSITPNGFAAPTVVIVVAVVIVGFVISLAGVITYHETFVGSPPWFGLYLVRACIRACVRAVKNATCKSITPCCTHISMIFGCAPSPPPPRHLDDYFYACPSSTLFL